MQNTHVTGDSFQTSTPGLSVKVSDVQIADDLSLLDASLIDEDLKKEVDESGRSWGMDEYDQGTLHV